MFRMSEITVKSRTFVATPAYRGEVAMQYAHCLVRDTVLSLLNGHYVAAPCCANNTHVHFARRDAALEFMKSDLDYLMFIDSDMGWQPGALVEILALPESYDVVGGVYRKKSDPPDYTVHSKPGVPLRFPVCEVSKVATFQHIQDPAVANGEWSEDYSFCIRAERAGCSIWGKFDILFDHVGPHAWTGRASDDLKHLTAVAA